MRAALVLAALTACGGASAVPAAPAPVAAGPEVEVVTLTAQPAITTTVRAAPSELAGALGAAIFGLVARAGAARLDVAGPPFARYLSRGDAADPTFVVEAGLPIVKPPEGEAVGELPAGPAAAIVHVGRHEDLGRAHAALDAWLAAHHRRAAGPRWEVFLTNPVTTPDPAQQRTKVFVPLAP